VTLARTSNPQAATQKPPPDDLPEKGAVIGRYVVLDLKGVGGMGILVSAYDSQLDRRVALKLVRPDLETKGGADARTRLIREAQLMARVRHPNVLSVYEVGERGDQVFIAMELVEGHTLRAWLREQQRTRNEVLDVFLQAGRALEAAHAAGVVHRDFKPDNVLIDGSGRAQVTDFGLAWSGAPPSGTPLERALPRTQVSTIVGTPAYMAPEQLKGRGSDGRSDQFSFCVALWEALTGQRPYQADDLRALEKAIDACNITPPQARMPSRLEAALRRGLDPDPQARFASMAELLARLTPRSRRPLWLALGASAAAALATFFLNQPGVGCEPKAPFAGVWDGARRVEVQKAFAADPGTFESVAAALDRRTADWLSSWKESCEATRLKKTQPEEVLVRQRVCLDARLDDLRALSDLFTNPTPGVLENAGLAVARLKPARACLTGEAFDALPLPQDARPRQSIAQARLELARSEARRTAGQSAEALESADAALALARLARYPPIEADAHLARVDPLRDLGRYQEARQELEQAALAAEAGRHFEALIRISVKNIRVIDSARAEEADGWIRRAENILQHSGRPDLQADLDLTVSILRLAQRRTAESRARALAALAYFERAGDVANALAGRHIAALALRAQGKAGAALAELEAALPGYDEALGPTHPLTLHVRMHLCEALLDLGRAGDARKVLESVELLAPGKLTTAWEVNRLGLLGLAQAMRGRYSAAAALHQQGLERALAQKVGNSLAPGARRFLAPTLREKEDFEGARREVKAALAEMEGAAHPPQVAVQLTRLELAELEAAEGKPAEALAHAERAAREVTALVDPAAPERVAAQLALARVALAAKQPSVALEAAEALLARDAEGPTRSRAVLLAAQARLARKDAVSEPELLASLEALGAAGIFPLERLMALEPLPRAQPALGPCEGSEAWEGLELGPKAAALLRDVAKRHCSGK
jgi:eukaryotic-like serine/threonine-protein kinase